MQHDLYPSQSQASHSNSWHQQAKSWNAQHQPQTVMEHNDPDRIEWTVVEQKEEERGPIVGQQVGDSCGQWTVGTLGIHGFNLYPKILIICSLRPCIYPWNTCPIVCTTRFRCIITMDPNTHPSSIGNRMSRPFGHGLSNTNCKYHLQNAQLCISCWWSRMGVDGWRDSCRR